MKELFIGILTYLVWTVVLFLDTDSALCLTSAPEWALMIGSLVGNTIWLMGLLFLAAAAGMVFMTLSPDVIPGVLKAKGDNEENVELSTLTFRNKVFLTFELAAPLTFVGSGYWFTGTMWLLFLGSCQWYRVEFNRLATKVIDKDNLT